MSLPTNGLTPVVLYTSSAGPFAVRINANIYKPNYAADTTGQYAAGFTPPNVAPVIPFGSEASLGTLVGAYLFEALGISFDGEPHSRTGTYGEDLGDGNVVRGKASLTSTIQMASFGVPTLLPGFYMNLLIGLQANSTGAAPVPCNATRWFIPKGGIQTNGFNNFTVSWMLDRVNSSPNFSEF